MSHRDRYVVVGASGLAIGILSVVATSKGVVSGEMAAWLQAVGALVAIGATVFLQSKDRDARREEAFEHRAALRQEAREDRAAALRDRLSVVDAIVDRCVAAVGWLDKKSQQSFTVKMLRHHADDVGATLRAVESVSLVELGEALSVVLDVQVKMATVMRRLRSAQDSLAEGEKCKAPEVADQLAALRRLKATLASIIDSDASLRPDGPPPIIPRLPSPAKERLGLGGRPRKQGGMTAAG